MCVELIDQERCVFTRLDGSLAHQDPHGCRVGNRILLNACLSFQGEFHLAPSSRGQPTAPFDSESTARVPAMDPAVTSLLDIQRHDFAALDQLKRL